MKRLILSRLRIIVCITLIVFIPSLLLKAQAPVLRSSFNFVDNNINGFWEYLPRDFTNNATRKYPLIIFLHGAGESSADPTQENLNRVLAAGLPLLLSNGTFPETFTVGTQTTSFMVFAPQIKNGIEISGSVGVSIVQPSTIDAMISYIKTTYPDRVDETRIYLCGLSMGGGAVWDYIGSSKKAAQKIAAVIIAAGSADLTTAEADTIATSEVPIIATHNNGDMIVLADRTRNNISKITSFQPLISPLPEALYWDINDHNVWTNTFEEITPSTTPVANLPALLGINAYEWLLQFSRNSALPVTWESFSALKINEKVELTWTVSNEKQLKYYQVEKSVNGSQWKVIGTLNPKPGAATKKVYSHLDNSPLMNINYYRIKEVDLDDKFTYSAIKTVDISRSKASYIVSPNPFSNEIKLNIASLTEPEICIELVNTTGRRLIKERHVLANNQLQYTLSVPGNVPSGIYYIRVSNKKGELLHTRMLVKP